MERAELMQQNESYTWIVPIPDMPDDPCGGIEVTVVKCWNLVVYEEDPIPGSENAYGKHIASLEVAVRRDEIIATMVRGMLEVVVPKRDSSQNRPIIVFKDRWTESPESNTWRWRFYGIYDADVEYRKEHIHVILCPATYLKLTYKGLKGDDVASAFRFIFDEFVKTDKKEVKVVRGTYYVFLPRNKPPLKPANIDIPINFVSQAMSYVPDDESKPKFWSLTESEIWKLIEEDVDNVSSQLALPYDAALLPLIRCGWHSDKVFKEWSADETKCREDIGLQQLVLDEIPQQDWCVICFKTDDSNMDSTYCGHSCCTSCWDYYLSTTIWNWQVNHDDGPATLKCPEPNCLAVIGPNLIRNLVSDKVIIETYFKRLMPPYLGAKRIKFCPENGCEFAVQIDSETSPFVDVVCKNFHNFCWFCKTKPHRSSRSWSGSYQPRNGNP